MKRIIILILVALMIPVAAFNITSDTRSQGRRKSSLQKPALISNQRQADLPAGLEAEGGGGRRLGTAPDTTLLGEWDFDDGTAQGWTVEDRTAQIDTFFHVADGSELDGGDFFRLLPISGSKSLWCGKDATPANPFCSWAQLPGYGSYWDQRFESETIYGDSIYIQYKISWDTEDYYDFGYCQYLDGGDWIDLNSYEGIGGPIYEAFSVKPQGDSTRFRFRFVSDGGCDDEDGEENTDGALIIDDIMTVSDGDTICDEDFESQPTGATDIGSWAASVPPAFGDYAALHAGASVLQENPCSQNNTYLWGFFDDPDSTDYGCGGHPEQGAMPYGPDEEGHCLDVHIISPGIQLTGSGASVKLRYSAYRDLPMDNLQFYCERVRSWVGGCPTIWGPYPMYLKFGDFKDWHRESTEIGHLIHPSADSIQIAIRVFDNYPEWGGVYGTGDCHSHAPLIDNISVVQIDNNGPVFSVSHVYLFQDNFSADGTVTGTARADMACDLLPGSNPSIRPGDSIVISVYDDDWGLGLDPYTGFGSAVYAFVSINGDEDPTPYQASETRSIGDRYPFVNGYVLGEEHYGVFRMDTVFSDAGFNDPVPDKFCFDLNDEVLAPGDTVSYFFGAMNDIGEWVYCSRDHGGQGSIFTTDDMNEAAQSPMEFCILPSPGRDILYVDDTDGLGGPAQLYFDDAFERIGISWRVDRFDVLAPSWCRGNSLASRVTDIFGQIISQYRVIIWSSGDLETGLIGDGVGGNPEKSDDFNLIDVLMDYSPDSPGIYLTGDDIAEEWSGLTAAGAVHLKGQYMNFNLGSGDHASIGEPVSPELGATGTVFSEMNYMVPPYDDITAFGGCPDVNDFDIINPAGLSVPEMSNPVSGNHYVISQVTPNSSASLSRAILSGFSFHNLADDTEESSESQRARHMEMVMEWLLNENLSVTDAGDQAPRFSDYLSQNFPNPFNPVTTIRYGVKNKGSVSLKIFDVSGRLVRTLVDSKKEPGNYRAVWDGRTVGGRDAASGVYFVRIDTPGFVQTRKMVLLK